MDIWRHSVVARHIMQSNFIYSAPRNLNPPRWPWHESYRFRDFSEFSPDVSRSRRSRKNCTISVVSVKRPPILYAVLVPRALVSELTSSVFTICKLLWLSLVIYGLQDMLPWDNDYTSESLSKLQSLLASCKHNKVASCIDFWSLYLLHLPAVSSDFAFLSPVLCSCLLKTNDTTEQIRQPSEKIFNEKYLDSSQTNQVMPHEMDMTSTSIVSSFHVLWYFLWLFPF